MYGFGDLSLTLLLSASYSAEAETYSAAPNILEGPPGQACTGKLSSPRPRGMA